MASLATDQSMTPGERAAAWLIDYCGQDSASDVLCTAGPDARHAWLAALEELANFGGSLAESRERAQRNAVDIGTGFRIAGEYDERPWPLSPVPLMIASDEWKGIEAGIIQRAELMERVLGDIYGNADLVRDGAIPAALVTGSRWFLRPMVGLTPPGGHHLHFFAADLGRDPDGQWRVIADHLRAPAGAGYALENRLAISRTLGGLQNRLNIQRHAPFFAALRDGIRASCRRADPRIGLLTPGRFNPSYAEQAHLARYLGFLLVEGADLTVLEDQLYVRTIAGLKRVDALWRRLDPRLLDPLAFDSNSAIGVAGLVDAMAAGNVVVSNSPGSGVIESPAFAAFLPALAERLTGAPLKMPNIATWWCGDDAACAVVEQRLDQLFVSPAFGDPPLGLPDGKSVLGGKLSEQQRATLLADLKDRPQDYVGQESLHLSHMPAIVDGQLVSRPFTLRVFAARNSNGGWDVLPGGFAQIGEHPDPMAAVIGGGNWSADVCVFGNDPVKPVSLLPSTDSVELRRNPGTLPSRVADNLFWLGRYLERGESLLTLIRVLLGHSITADTGAALSRQTLARLTQLIVRSGAAAAPDDLSRKELGRFVQSALEDGPFSIRAVNQQIASIGEISRDRLAADLVQLIDAPFPEKGSLLDRAGTLQRRYAAIAGLAAEHMARTDAWRFHDMGRRVERGMNITETTRQFIDAGTSVDDLSTLLDLADSQISYRQRYLTGVARVPVLDLVLLDPGNPRALAYQVERIRWHLDKLPLLSDNGLAEPQQALSREVAALVQTARAQSIDDRMLTMVSQMMAQLSDEIARRYFLQGAEPIRSAGLTLA